MSIQDNNAPKADRGQLRKAIRKSVVSILKGNTDAGGRVFPNASVPPWAEELPVILVYPRSEGASLYSMAPRELERDLDLAIEIVATGPEENPDLESPELGQKSLEDILDDISEQVETALNADDTLGNTASESFLQNTEFEFESSGGQPIGSARLTYGVTYYTHSPRKETLPDLDKTAIDWDINDDPNTIEAEDDIDLLTE